MPEDRNVLGEGLETCSTGDDVLRATHEEALE
jgi:hypothetical protein